MHYIFDEMFVPTYTNSSNFPSYCAIDTLNSKNKKRSSGVDVGKGENIGEWVLYGTCVLSMIGVLVLISNM